uniref:Uncharacterized protein n=1 Tax=Chromera velia CCMP2878 TaxID=1169474 RepID=A0A0G4HRV5_9ALVE|eukprot:Cvel_30816.t1-p1 / transcript=Cvel_30816.t1 / gene=Cvel_30816 / organism=Chromera_velia_CCMP2878 / gene_product=hypothetical protein / transcript_product=hypothetical protein / location=Cvel_scaffold4470:1660-9348(+) / protein_length=736 / sequence_SO=supercontig / SO=protein_coding / is_pseudo=false
MGRTKHPVGEKLELNKWRAEREIKEVKWERDRQQKQLVEDATKGISFGHWWRKLAAHPTVVQLYAPEKAAQICKLVARLEEGHVSLSRLCKAFDDLFELYDSNLKRLTITSFESSQWQICEMYLSALANFMEVFEIPLASSHRLLSKEIEQTRVKGARDPTALSRVGLQVRQFDLSLVSFERRLLEESREAFRHLTLPLVELMEAAVGLEGSCRLTRGGGAKDVYTARLLASLSQVAALRLLPMTVPSERERERTQQQAEDEGDGGGLRQRSVPQAASSPLTLPLRRLSLGPPPSETIVEQASQEEQGAAEGRDSRQGRKKKGGEAGGEAQKEQRKEEKGKGEREGGVERELSSSAEEMTTSLQFSPSDLTNIQRNLSHRLPGVRRLANRAFHWFELAFRLILKVARPCLGGRRRILLTNERVGRSAGQDSEVETPGEGESFIGECLGHQGAWNALDAGGSLQGLSEAKRGDGSAEKERAKAAQSERDLDEDFVQVLKAFQNRGLMRSLSNLIWSWFHARNWLQPARLEDISKLQEVVDAHRQRLRRAIRTQGLRAAQIYLSRLVVFHEMAEGDGEEELGGGQAKGNGPGEETAASNSSRKAVSSHSADTAETHKPTKRSIRPFLSPHERQLKSLRTTWSHTQLCARYFHTVPLLLSAACAQLVCPHWAQSHALLVAFGQGMQKRLLSVERLRLELAGSNITEEGSLDSKVFIFVCSFWNLHGFTEEKLKTVFRQS